MLRIRADRGGLASTGIAFFLVAVMGAQPAGTSPLAAQTPTDPSLREAVDVFQSGDFNQARRLLEARPASGLSNRDLAIRDLYRAIVHFGLGEEAQARALMRTAAEADVSVRLDPNLHAPNRIALYESIRRPIEDARRVTQVAFTSPPATIREGRSAQFSVRALDRNGSALPGDRAVLWSVSDAAVLSVSAAGVVTGNAPGSASVIAEVEGVRTSHQLSVRPEVVEIDGVEARLDLTAGETAQLRAQPRGRDGGVLNVPVEFSSNAPRVVEVGTGGLVRAVAAGTATIRVAAEDVSSTILVEVARRPVASVAVTPGRSVLEIGGRVDLNARTLAAGGGTLTGRDVEWSSSDRGAASVTADGGVRGLSPGLFVISAASEGASGEAQIRVLPRRRNPTGAFVTGMIFPGGGQFSVGRPTRGAITLLGAAGAAAWGYLSTETVQFCASPTESGASCPSADVLSESVERPNLIPGVAAAAGVMLISAIDAALYGGRQNREAERLRAAPWGDATPDLDVDPDGAVSASWRIHVR